MAFAFALNLFGFVINFNLVRVATAVDAVAAKVNALADNDDRAVLGFR